MPLLDVIIIVSESTPKSFVHECRLSVKRAADRCSAVRVLESPGVPGHIGKARLKSLATSTAEYVAWVDDDDLVLPHAFSVVLPHLAARPSAVCARELHWLNNGLLRPNSKRHHLTAFRRDIVDAVPFAELPCRDAPALHSRIEPDAIDVLDWCYIRRIRQSAGYDLRAEHSPRG